MAEQTSVNTSSDDELLNPPPVVPAVQVTASHADAKTGHASSAANVSSDTVIEEQHQGEPQTTARPHGERNTLETYERKVSDVSTTTWRCCNSV